MDSIDNIWEDHFDLIINDYTSSVYVDIMETFIGASIKVLLSILWFMLKAVSILQRWNISSRYLVGLCSEHFLCWRVRCSTLNLHPIINMVSQAEEWLPRHLQVTLEEHERRTLRYISNGLPMIWRQKIFLTHQYVEEVFYLG